MDQDQVDTAALISATKEQTGDPDLRDVFFHEEHDDSPVREGVDPPVDPDGQIKLTKEHEEEFVKDVLDLLDFCDSAGANRRDQEDEVESYYDLESDPIQGGRRADDARLTSELLMKLVDQATSRIVDNVMGVNPLIKVDPVVTDQATAEDEKDSRDMATATERFLHTFGLLDMDLKFTLPIAIGRACKVGTAVLYQSWQTIAEREEFHDKNGVKKVRDKERGTIIPELIDNRHVIVYPPNQPNWQKADIVGHRSYHSKSNFRDYARDLGLSESEIKELEFGGPDEEENKPTIGRFFSGDSEELREKVGHVQTTQLFMRWVLPGDFESRSIQIVLSESKKKLLYIHENPFHTNLYPYAPIRYKISDKSAWGQGVGHEVLMSQCADSVFRNLEIDNLMSGGYGVTLMRAGTIASTVKDRFSPGQVIPVDDMDDIRPIQLGGVAAGLTEAKQDNRFRASEASGLAPVLGGQGDPTLKSGGGTGSTVALIEQAGKKFGHVDRTMRLDLTGFYTTTLELVAQFASEGLFYRHVSSEDAGLVRMLKFIPARGPVSGNYQVHAQAPNAATSQEGRKHSLLTLWQFIGQYGQMVIQQGDPIFGQQNPAGWQRYKEEMLALLSQTAIQVIDMHDLPGLSGFVPDLPEMTPQDELMNQLMQQMQQQQQQLQQATQENEQFKMMMQQAQGQGGPLQGPPQGPPPGVPPGGGQPPPGTN